MKKFFLYTVSVILLCLTVSSCCTPDNKPYEVKIISKSDTIRSRIVVIYNGKTSMPMRQVRHFHYLTLQYRDPSIPNSRWSQENILDVNSKVYEKYEIGKTYTVNSHTHIEPGDSIPRLCSKTL